ncbi:HD domain-containing phosphohydrolase [Maridesulfovibrio bastinii]|uniref:HD domain-containing phosphohydrolase n=1 Tax=Maridesulfovibrio bastinii TaxID=47157 RepID=UPI00041EA8A4|nr:HD domain-containing phosphohydrolase [Maridesulfovibrio bastinii]
MQADELKILVIDDEDFVRDTIKDYLMDSGFEVCSAGDGEEGLKVFNEEEPDAVLVDLNMPRMDGFAFLEQLKKIDEDVPVIVVSGAGLIQDAIKAVRFGAWDFVTKPILDMNILEHALNRAFERAGLIRENKLYREHLESEVQRRTEDLRQEVRVRREAQEALLGLQKEVIDTQKEIILTLGEVVETRSNETANHVRRVAEFSRILASKLGMNDEDVNLIRMASPMHDVGKIGIPDTILNKPGRLTVDEFEIIKRHTVLGYEILKHSSRPIMKAAAIVAHEHHERWDGKGYPRGLAGEDIHIFGRILCITDVFDALGSDRVYKKAWSLDKILELFNAERGKQFDPDIADVFLKNLDDFLAVKEAYPDGEIATIPLQGEIKLS